MFCRDETVLNCVLQIYELISSRFSCLNNLDISIFTLVLTIGNNLVEKTAREKCVYRVLATLLSLPTNSFAANARQDLVICSMI